MEGFFVRISAVVLGLVVVTQPLSAADDDVIELEPRGNWVLDDRDEQCRILRAFGDKDEPTVLIIEQDAPTHTFSWTVAGPSFKRYRNERPVTVQWGPSFEPFEFDYLPASLGTYGPAVIGLGWYRFETDDEKKAKLPDDLRDIERAVLQSGFRPVIAKLDVQHGAAIESISFSQRFRPKTVLNTGNLGPIFSKMNECTGKLALSWGFDESYQDRLASGAIWVNQDDVAKKIIQTYPRQALLRGSQANFILRIIVGADGTPKLCSWLSKTKADDFEMSKTPCDHVIERAEFDPALDEAGNPIRSIFITSVVYRING